MPKIIDCAAGSHDWDIDVPLRCVLCGYEDERPLPYPDPKNYLQAFANGFTLGMRRVENDELLPRITQHKP